MNKRKSQSMYMVNWWKETLIRICSSTFFLTQYPGQRWINRKYLDTCMCIYFSANKDSKEKGGKGGSKENAGKGKRTGSAKSIERPASVSIDISCQL